MSTHQLVFSPAAQEDLREIYRFGLRHWGANQASKYLEKLKEHLWTLTEEPLIGRKRPELFPELRSLPIESHIVFYQVRPPKVEIIQVEIIRVLHGRQDPNQYLGQDKSG